MTAHYQAIYRDKFGEEQTVIENDGQTLRMVARGVELVADDPDSFSLVGMPAAESLARLPLYFGNICSYTLSFDIPIHIVKNEGIADGLLRLQYDMGGPRGDGTVNRGLEREDITASLEYDDRVFATSKRHGFLEDAISEIQAAMPAGVYMRVCLNCEFGLESEMGCGGFATLGCFRDEKDQARQVQNIFDVCRLWDRKTAFVQGIHVCPQFERRSTTRP